MKHIIKLPCLRLLMADQLRTRKELQERNSALFDLTIDEGLIEQKVIEHTERELELINEQIELTANQGFEGYSHSGGITTLFYGYSPTERVPGIHPGASSQRSA